VVNELSCRWEQTQEKESATICEHVEHWKTTGAVDSTGCGSSGAGFVEGGCVVMFVTRKRICGFRDLNFLARRSHTHLNNFKMNIIKSYNHYPCIQPFIPNQNFKLNHSNELILELYTV